MDQFSRDCRRVDIMMRQNREMSRWIKKCKIEGFNPLVNSQRQHTRNHQNLTRQQSDENSGGSDAISKASKRVSSAESKSSDDTIDLGRQAVIDKCQKWVSTLPDKFSGLHLVTVPSSSVD